MTEDGSKTPRGTSQQSRPRETTSRCARGSRPCARGPARPCRKGAELRAGKRAESSAHLITPPAYHPPAWPFLPRSRCTKGNNIRQAVFFLGSGKREGYVPPHPAAAGTLRLCHHRFTKGGRQPCAWSSQTRSDPKGAQLLLSLPAGKTCTQWAASFPQCARPSLPHLHSISNRGPGLVHLDKNQSQPLGLEQN